MALPDFSARAVPAEPGGPDFSSRAKVPPRRTAGRRTADNFVDTYERSSIGQTSRRLRGADGKSGWEDVLGSVSIREGGALDQALDWIGFDEVRGAVPEEVKRERERRNAFAALSAADPWNAADKSMTEKLLHGGSALAGVFGASAVSPENWINPGGGIVRRAAGQGAANAGLDVLEQGGSVFSGVQDRYEPMQTGAAFGLGAGLSLTGDAFAAGGRAAAQTPAGQSVVEGVRTAKAKAKAAVSSVKLPDFSARARPPAGPDPVVDDGGAKVFVDPATGERSPYVEGGNVVDLFRKPQSEVGKEAAAPDVRAEPPVVSVTPAPDAVTPVGRTLDSATLRSRLDSVGQDMGALGRDVRAEVQQALERGEAVSLVVEGKPRPIVDTAGGSKLLDAEGRDWGLISVLMPADGDNARIEFGPKAETPSPAPGAASAPKARPEFPDQHHSSLYDLGVALRQGDRSPETLARLDGLRTTLGRYMDFSDYFERYPGQRARFGENREPSAELFARAARDYADSIDRAPEEAWASLYDPEAAAELVMRSGDGVKLAARRTRTTDQSGGGRTESAAPFDPARPPDRLAARTVAQGPDFSARSTLASRNPGGLRAAPRPGAVPKGKGGTYEGQTVKALAERLRASLGLTARQGRMTLKGGAVGEYDPKSGVIRTKAVQEMDVLAHEGGHALEFKKIPALTAVLRKHAGKLSSMAYPGAPASVQREEGFAEFFRWYVTNPDHARKLAPNFYDDFEAALGSAEPAMLSDLREIQAAYRDLQLAASVDLAAGSVGYTGRKGPLSSLVDELDRNGVGGTVQRIADDAYTAFVDDLHPISKAVRRLQQIYADNTGQRLDLKVAKNPYALARLSREAYAAGHVDLMEGVVPYRGVDPEGPSLSQALEKALGAKVFGDFKKDDLARFDAYLIARRIVHEWDRYARGELPHPPDKYLKEFHEQVIADSEAANPTWKDAAGMVYDWIGALWKKEHEAGLISKAIYEAGLTNHPDYVPLMRDVSDKGGPGGRRSAVRGQLQYAGGVKAFEGSTRDVLSPLSTMMRRAFELNAVIKRNDVFKALDDLAEAAGPGAGEIVERLPAKESYAVEVDAGDALRAAAAEAGLSPRDLTLVEAAADIVDGQSVKLWKQRDAEPRKGEAVVFVWREGKKTPLLLPDGEFGQSMFRALSGLTPDMRNVVVDSMAAASQMLRYGVTLSPEFMARNFVRDQLATFINTDVGFRPVVDAVRGLGDELTQNAFAIRYQAAGGLKGGANVAATKRPFPQNDAQALQQLQHLRKKGYKVKRFASWRGLAEFTDLSESSTRLGVARLAFKQAKKRGLNDYEAMTEAAFVARDYLDFGRRGSRMLTAARIVTFLNAALQGLDKSVRVLTGGGNLQRVLAPFGKNAPRTATERRALAHAYKAWAKVSALGALGLSLRMIYADDPEYEEIGDRLRATHWVFKSEGRWVFVPKPFELATVSNILERAYEAGALKDKTAPERLLKDFKHTIAPPHEVPALSIPFQIARNRDHMGRPIVPDHLRDGVEPAEQFNSYTSEFGKLVGRTLGVSPAVVDHVITGFGGTLGRYGLQSYELGHEAVTGAPSMKAGPEDMFLSRGFVRRVDRGSVSQERFWDLVAKSGGKFTQDAGTAVMMARDGRDAELSAYVAKLKPDERSYVLAALAGGQMTKAHPLHRAQESVRVLGELRKENREDKLVGPDMRAIRLSPGERRTVDDALAELAMIEMRNGLIAAGVKGWEQKDYMRPSEALDRLGAVSQALPTTVRARWAEEKVLPAGAAARVWPELEKRIATVGPERLARRRRTDTTAERRDELRRLVAAGRR